MDVGLMMIFSSYGWEDGSDGQMWKEDLYLAEIAADSGSTAFGPQSTISTIIPSCRTKLYDPPCGQAPQYRRGDGRRDTPLA